MSKIAYYITAHGYGHGTRSCDIIRALHAADPELQTIIRTDLPEAFFEHRLPDGAVLVPGAFDSGLIQKDAIQADLEASLNAADEMLDGSEELISNETAFLRREGIGAVVADIPALPLMAAKKVGIPAIATGNFGWDWIYADFVPMDARWQRHVDLFRAAYSETDLLLRQPFAEPMEMFPHSIDLPLLAGPGKACRDRIAEASGADPHKPWVLLAFTSLDLDAGALDNLSHLRRCDIFSVEPLEWPGSGIHYLPRALAPFSDLLASMDTVVTKPGFGIVSECIANDKPIIYTERTDFREYDNLVEGIQRYCRHAFIPPEDLYAGRLENALEAADAAPPPLEQMVRGGAAIAAERILKLAGF